MIEIFITTGKDERLTDKLCAAIRKSKMHIVTGTFHKLGDCRERLAHNKAPHILLLGLAMRDGNGMDFCAEVKEKYPGIRILMLADDDEYSIIRRAMDNGAMGFIRKNVLPEELIAGLNAVMEGKIYLGSKIGIRKNEAPEEAPGWLSAVEKEILASMRKDCCSIEVMVERLSLLAGSLDRWHKMLITQLLARNDGTTGKETTEAYLRTLSEKLFLEGYSNWEIVDELRGIADRLNIDINTVRIYRMRLIQKLGAKNSMMFAKKKTNDIIRLKPDDIQLIRLVAAGFTSKEIADKLPCVGIEAIKSRRKKLILDTGAKNMLELIIDALRQGLIKLDDIEYLHNKH
ncbi:MAG: response regulator transcription factor [Tannerellaceae bacterium]|jgi:DNA-binding NarL/FixJ family response regulator|nr:response regulator transcription factor [Tannerellaceae bacterium]